MLNDRYQLNSSESIMSFEFVSEGSKGKIVKIIQYHGSPVEAVYYLGFGDKKDNSRIDDQTISNNGDSRKVLATVAWSVYLFTEKYPDAWIAAFGNTNVKTRLYRMGINTIWKDIKEDFDVYGFKNGAALPFVKDESYDGFLIKRK